MHSSSKSTPCRPQACQIAAGPQRTANSLPAVYNNWASGRCLLVEVLSNVSDETKQRTASAWATIVRPVSKVIHNYRSHLGGLSAGITLHMEAAANLNPVNTPTL